MPNGSPPPRRRPTSAGDNAAVPRRPTGDGDAPAAPRRPTSAGDNAAVPRRPTSAGDNAAVPRRPTSAGDNAAVPRRPTSAGDNAAVRRPSPENAPAGPRRAPAQPGPQRGAASSPKLVCTAGPKAGTEFVLDAEQVVVGRATEADISIPDTSVSRRHAHLRKVRSAWVIADLGSGNGTLVNGEPVEDERTLRSGDVITCGDTELSFVEDAPSTARRPVPQRPGDDEDDLDSPARRAPTPGRPRVARAQRVDPVRQQQRKRILIVGLSAITVLFAALGVLKYRQHVQQQQHQAVAAERERTRTQLSELFQEGKNLVRAGKWDEAKVRFEQIQQSAPDYPGVQDYLTLAAKEIPNQQQLAAAEKALLENQVAAANAALVAVTPETQQFEQLRRLKAALDQKVIERVKEAEQAALAAGRLPAKAEAIAGYQKVVAIADDVLAAFPDERDASVLRQNASSRIAELSYVPPPPPPPTRRPWEDATRQFIDGDLSGAFAIANNCAAKGNAKCREKVALMKQFSERYKQLEELDARGLSSLLALNDRITDGRPSKFSRTAGTRAANLFFKSASAAKAAGQWGRSLEYAQQALKADPNHSGAKAVVAELKSKARDVYLQGYAMKDTQPDDAVQKFRDVLLLAPPTDEWHQKAKRWIAELSR